MASALHHAQQAEGSHTKSVPAGYCPILPLLLNERPEHLHPVLASTKRAKRATESKDGKKINIVVVTGVERNERREAVKTIHARA